MIFTQIAIFINLKHNHSLHKSMIERQNTMKLIVLKIQDSRFKIQDSRFKIQVP
jgi:hypothetical protein